MDTKVCRKCLIESSVDNFYKNSAKCKTCCKEYAKAWAKANPEKYKMQWQKKNKKRWVEQKQDQAYMLKKAIYRQENSARRVANAKAWNEANKQRYHQHVATSHIKRRIAKDARAYKILDKEYSNNNKTSDGLLTAFVDARTSNSNSLIAFSEFVAFFITPAPLTFT